MRLAGLLAIALPAFGAVCNPNDFPGAYGFQLNGETRITKDARPSAGLGRLVFDAERKVGGISTVMFSGLLLGNPVTGTYEVRNDCTVDWSLQDDSGAFQHFHGTIDPETHSVQFRQTDRGGPQHGLMLRSADACTAQNMQKAYNFTLAGAVAARGVIEVDQNGNWRSATEGNPSPVGSLIVAVEPDCFVNLEFSTPPMKLRGILVNDGKGILVIEADPNVLASGTFTSR